MTQHKAAWRLAAAGVVEPRTVGARKRATLNANAVGAPGAVANQRAASVIAKCRAVSTFKKLSPAPTAHLPTDRAGALRGDGTTRAHPVRYPARNAEAPGRPGRRRRRSIFTADSTDVLPPVKKEMRVNVGATRVGNLFARLQLHLATARFLAELRADALWQTACNQASLALDSLASGMTPDALAAPLHSRVAPGGPAILNTSGDAEWVPRTAARAPACTSKGRLGQGSGVTRASALAAPNLTAVTARRFAVAITASGRGGLATGSGALTANGPAPAVDASDSSVHTARGSTPAVIAYRATAHSTSDSAAFTASGAALTVRRAALALPVPNVKTPATLDRAAHSPHHAARQPFSRQRFTRHKGAR